MGGGGFAFKRDGGVNHSFWSHLGNYGNIYIGE